MRAELAIPSKTPDQLVPIRRSVHRKGNFGERAARSGSEKRFPAGSGSGAPGAVPAGSARSAAIALLGRRGHRAAPAPQPAGTAPAPGPSKPGPSRLLLALTPSSRIKRSALAPARLPRTDLVSRARKSGCRPQRRRARAAGEGPGEVTAARPPRAAPPAPAEGCPRSRGSPRS